MISEVGFITAVNQTSYIDYIINDRTGSKITVKVFNDKENTIVFIGIIMIRLELIY